MAHECPARRERISSIYKVEGRQKENKNQFQTVCACVYMYKGGIGPG
jgi:hypothetical protein